MLGLALKLSVGVGRAHAQLSAFEAALLAGGFAGVDGAGGWRLSGTRGQQRNGEDKKGQSAGHCELSRVNKDRRRVIRRSSRADTGPMQRQNSAGPARRSGRVRPFARHATTPRSSEIRWRTWCAGVWCPVHRLLRASSASGVPSSRREKRLAIKKCRPPEVGTKGGAWAVCSMARPSLSSASSYFRPRRLTSPTPGVTCRRRMRAHIQSHLPAGANRLLSRPNCRFRLETSVLDAPAPSCRRGAKIGGAR